jgi:Mn-containing catalase
MAEPTIRVETREELIYLLAEAAAVEHSIMCCYLYGAWSLKRSTKDGLTPDQVEAVKRWRKAIVSVAVEEMGHLALVANLTSSVGAGPHFSRPDFPVPAGRQSAGQSRTPGSHCRHDVLPASRSAAVAGGPVRAGCHGGATR